MVNVIDRQCGQLLLKWWFLGLRLGFYRRVPRWPVRAQKVQLISARVPVQAHRTTIAPWEPGAMGPILSMACGTER